MNQTEDALSGQARAGGRDPLLATYGGIPIRLFPRPVLVAQAQLLVKMAMRFADKS
jgi:hypothetical protein